MDLRAYYKTLREFEGTIGTAQAVVVSMATPDGGKPGVVTEVPRAIAARMVVEGSARLASEAESNSFREQNEAARRAFEEAAAVSRVQVVVVPTSASQARMSTRPEKEA